jgi:hypothetical protein
MHVINGFTSTLMLFPSVELAPLGYIPNHQKLSKSDSQKSILKALAENYTQKNGNRNWLRFF